MNEGFVSTNISQLCCYLAGWKGMCTGIFLIEDLE
jgi:hypothetical protein